MKKLTKDLKIRYWIMAIATIVVFIVLGAVLIDNGLWPVALIMCGFVFTGVAGFMIKYLI